MTKRTAIIQVSGEGAAIARRLSESMDACIIARTEVERQWKEYGAFVFIGAMGICVRTIAPCIEDKHTDPAVVCVDSMGRHAVAVLSGHVGGANELAGRIASVIGAEAVITTQSDNAGLWPLDTLDLRFGWQLLGDKNLNEQIFAFVNHQPTALLSDVSDEGTAWLERTLPPHVTIVQSAEAITADRFRLAIIISPRLYPP